MEKVRVTILVDGGNVQAVDCGDFVDVEIVDYDNLRAEGKTADEREAIWEAVRVRSV